MTDEELRCVLAGGIIYRDLKPWDLFSFAEDIARELLEARATIKWLTDELDRWSYGEATRGVD